MAYFIHCNKCYTMYNPKIRFVMTSCGHIFCEKCAKAIQETRRCAACNQESSLVLLDNNNHSLRHLFIPPCEQFKDQVQATTFKQMQEDHLIKVLQEKVAYAQKANQVWIERCKKIEQQIEKLRSYLNSSSAGKNTFSPHSVQMSTPSSMSRFTPMSQNKSLLQQLPRVHGGTPGTLLKLQNLKIAFNKKYPNQ